MPTVPPSPDIPVWIKLTRGARQVLTAASTAATTRATAAGRVLGVDPGPRMAELAAVTWVA